MIFIASLLAIFAVSSIIYSSLFRSSSEKGIKVSHNKKDEFLIFDEFKGLYKTNILLSNLSTSETPFGSLKNYDYNNIKNVLLFDYVTKKSQWIFSNNQNYIYRDHTYIHENSDDDCCMRSEEPKSKTIGIIFKFADKDTNNDEKNYKRRQNKINP